MFVVYRDGKPRASGIYRIAGHVVQITTCYFDTHTMCESYACEGEPEFVVETTVEDIFAESILAKKEDALEGLPERKYPRSLLETTAVYRKLTNYLIDKGIFLFHGSVIALDGEGYLFTAKSGTGKSTHTRLWRELFGQRAVMVNDDKPLLEPTQSGVIVHGTPWNGKHNLGTNISVPLKAICILERGEENHIERVEASQAFPLLLQQSNRSMGAEKMLKTLELLDTALRKIPVYKLQCNMEPEAARVAYEGMK